jgi:sugar phosphate isomerase/epimerase
MDCKAQDINIGYVYDVGNWSWVDEDEFDNANVLKEFARYVHLKDVKKISNGNLTLPLDEGNINWRKALRILPKGINVGLEYPCGNNSIVKEGIKKLLE